MTPTRLISFGAAAGLLLGGIYALSPLTVWTVALAAAVLALAGRGLPGAEARLLRTVLAAALAVRLIAIGGLFLTTMPKHDDQIVGSLAGDEAYGLARALRTRNILLGEPVSKYDYIVAFDEYGRNRYMAILTAAQVIFGPTPYSMRLLNSVIFTLGAVLLFRTARRAFGALPAFGGLLAILFLPTLFVWSISLLKESLYFAGTALVLAAAVHAVRASTWPRRASALVVAVAAVAMLRDLRPGSVVLVAGGVGMGLVAAALTTSGRRASLALAGALAAAVLLLQQPWIQQQAVTGLDAAAKMHIGHVFTVGHDYKLLDEGFYFDPKPPGQLRWTLTPAEGARFVIRGFTSFVTLPLPWQLASRRELLYVPMLLIWYALVLLLPFGAIAGWRRDRFVTCMLIAYVIPTAVALALTNGNVGTLVRFRDLVTPYIVWVSALGFCEVVARGFSRARRNA